MARSVVLLGLLVFGLAHCKRGGPTVAEAMPDQATCGVVKAPTRPLVVEWPSGDRLDLERRIRSELVVVRYEGCEMEVLSTCRAVGSYTYSGITRKHDSVTMKREADLYANIPVHAAKFVGKLESSAGLEVSMTMVGSYNVDPFAASGAALQGDCEAATHVITGVTVGAFEFFAHRRRAAQAQVEVGPHGAAGGGGGVSGERESLTRDGDANACETATSADDRPPENCGAVLRLEVHPISIARASTSSPAPATASGSDLDGDGVANADDRCPSEHGDPANRGCPGTGGGSGSVMDTDGDGITDDLDQCLRKRGSREKLGC